MPQINGFCARSGLLKKVVGELSEERAEEIKSQYDEKRFKEVFSNADLLATCFCLFENDLNVSLTARKLYMHRNTLIYRLNKIQRLSGLNVCSFDDAITFLLLYELYAKKSDCSAGGGK